MGPDEESEQWVQSIAEVCGHPYVIGKKQRFGDRQVHITLPSLERFKTKTAVIIDDVIASGFTILECVATLREQGIEDINCAAVHGIFAEGSDQRLLESGLQQLITCNTLVHESNKIDVSSLLVEPVRECLNTVAEAKP